METDADLRHAVAKINEIKEQDEKKRLGLDRAEAQQIVSDLVGEAEEKKTEAARGPLAAAPRIVGDKPRPPAPAVPAESPEPPAAEEGHSANESPAAVADTKKQRSVIVTGVILVAVATLAVLVIVVLRSNDDDKPVSDKTVPGPTVTSWGRRDEQGREA